MLKGPLAKRVMTGGGIRSLVTIKEPVKQDHFPKITLNTCPMPET